MDGAQLLPEFDREATFTRKALERVPDGRLDFKPHEKSYSLLDLANHVANLLSWTAMTLSSTELDLDQPFDRTWPTDREGILASFDATAAEAREALAAASSEDLAVDWTLRVGDDVVFTMPREDVYRYYVINHLIHHRAQLGVYLRLLDVPVPGMYGPSADEQ